MNLTESLINAVILGVGMAIGTAIGQIILDKMKNNSDVLKKVMKKREK